MKPNSSTADMFRAIFKFGVFNAVQSTCYDTVGNLPFKTHIVPLTRLVGDENV